MKKPIFIITAIVLTIVVLSVVRVVVSNSISTGGIALDKIEEDLSSYKTQNAILKEKLLTITSLDYISSKASMLGFTMDKSSFTLNKPLPLAIKQ